jgi:hypothetical protein
MNWVLILVLYWSGGTSSQQVGPYVSSADCERAYIVMESQDKVATWPSVKQHFCVPRPISSSGGNANIELPKEFD